IRHTPKVTPRPSGLQAHSSSSKSNASTAAPSPGSLARNRRNRASRAAASVSRAGGARAGTTAHIRLREANPVHAEGLARQRDVLAEVLARHAGARVLRREPDWPRG